MALSSQFVHLHGQAGALQTQLLRIGATALSGGILLGVGAAMAKMFDRPIQRAMELQGEISKLSTLPLGPGILKLLEDGARAETRRTPTSTTVGNIGYLREMIGAFGPVEGNEEQAAREALAVLPYVNQIDALMRIAGKPQQFIGRDLVKLVDLSIRNGQVMTPELMAHHSNLISKAIVAQGGAINVNNLLQAAQASGSSYAKWTDDFKYSIFPTMVAETAGSPSQIGTWLNYLDRAGGGRRLMSKHNLKYWLASGLIDERFIDVNNFTGGVFTDPRALVDQQLFRRDKLEWVRKHMPAIQSGAASIGLESSDYLSILFGNSVQADKAMSQIWNSFLTLDREGKFTRANAGLGNYQKMLETNPTMFKLVIAAQQTEISGNVGKIFMPIYMAIMQHLMPNLQGLSQWVQENPAKVKTLTVAFLGLAASMMIAGTVMLLNAAFKALAITLGLVRIANGQAVLGPILTFLFALRGGAAGAAAISRLGPWLQVLARGLRLLISPITFLLRPLAMFVASVAACNPVAVAIAAALVAVGAACLWAYNNLGWFRAGVDAVVVLTQRLFKAIKDGVMGLFNWVKGILPPGMVKSMGGFFAGITAADPNAVRESREMRARWGLLSAAEIAEDRRAAVPGARNGQPIVVQSTLKLDGVTVARAVSHPLAMGIGGVSGGGTGWDPAQTAPSPGGSYTAH
jgi:hypothetical protein